MGGDAKRTDETKLLKYFYSELSIKNKTTVHHKQDHLDHTGTAVPVLFSKVPTVPVLKKYRGTAHLCLRLRISQLCLTLAFLNHVVGRLLKKSTQVLRLSLTAYNLINRW